MAAEIDPSDITHEYSYFALCCAPGYKFDEFEMADIKTLQSTYPEHSEIINRLALWSLITYVG